MKKSGLIIGLVVLVALGGVIVWLIVNKTATPTDNTQNSTSNSSNNSSTDTSNNSSQQAQSGTADVVMQNTAFSPQRITVKKGTKVTWTNNDSVRHNVVADSSAAGGLPTDNALLGKGESYSFTFNTTGTFTYHCVPHPFMTGTVEVVD